MMKWRLGRSLNRERGAGEGTAEAGVLAGHRSAKRGLLQSRALMKTDETPSQDESFKVQNNIKHRIAIDYWIL